MADVFCTSQAVIRKAGANVSSTASASSSLISSFINQAEAFVCTASKFNFLDAYNSLDVSMAKLLEDATSSLAACQLIAYDMSGYTSRNEAQTMLDVQRDFALRVIDLLKEKGKDVVSFLRGA